MSNMNVLMSNTTAMFTNRQLGITNNNKAKSSEKLSSGYRINRAADDAAGLTISEKMRYFIRGLHQGSKNIQDGVNLCQVADGALNEVHDMLHRLDELAIKSANGTNTSEDRKAIDKEAQALKEEMSRIFETTAFNEKRIFNVPYIPEVKGLPDSFQVFNVRLDGGEVRYGGIEINNIRHTWSELGIQKYIGSDGKTIHIPANEDEIESDAKITKDIKFTLKDGTGETVCLRLTDGATLPDISRVYEWSADGRGITINGLFAKSWDELGVTDSGAENGVLQFTHKGITYTQKTGSDSKSEIISGINGNGLHDGKIFTASVGINNRGKAVDISGVKSITITNANKSLMDDNYSISADSEGVTITIKNGSGVSQDPDRDSSGRTYTKIRWEDFTDQRGSSFKIKDFGLSDNANTADTKTFDDSAVYSYTDSTTGIRFSFQLTDEASFDAIIKGMNMASISESYSAGGTTTLSGASGDGRTGIDSRGDTIKIVNQYIGGNSLQNVRAQKALGRNFDSNSPIDVSIEKSVSLNGAATITEHTADDGFKIVNGSSDDSAGGTSSRKVYIYKNGKYTVYEETTSFGTLKREKNSTTTFTQAFSVDYSVKAGGVLMNSTPPSGNMTASFTDRDTETKTSKYVSGYEYNLVGSYDDTPSDAYEIREMQTLTGHEKDDDKLVDIQGSETTEHKRTVNMPNLTQNLSVSAANGVSLLDLSLTTSAGSLFRNDSSGYFKEEKQTDGTYKLVATGNKGSQNVRFQPAGSASVTFSAQENTSGNIANSPKFNRFKALPPRKKLILQAGDPAENDITMEWDALNLTILGISNTNMLTADDAKSAIEEIGLALDRISTERSVFGAYQNRLEHAIAINDNTSENLSDAESRIRDTDMADESVRLAKESILQQVGQSMLAQANQQKQGILNLIQ